MRESTHMNANLQDEVNMRLVLPVVQGWTINLKKYGEKLYLFYSFSEIFQQQNSKGQFSKYPKYSVFKAFLSLFRPFCFKMY